MGREVPLAVVGFLKRRMINWHYTYMYITRKINDADPVASYDFYILLYF